MAKERRSMRNYSRRCLLNDSRRAKILNPIFGVRVRFVVKYFTTFVESVGKVIDDVGIKRAS